MSNPDDTDPSRTLGDDDSPLEPRADAPVPIRPPTADPPASDTPASDPIGTTSALSDRPSPSEKEAAPDFAGITTSVSHRPSPPPEQENVGRLLAGRYRLIEQLGKGAHGEVWAAEDTVVKAQVAVKWLLAPRNGGLARLRREITALRMLRVPGVVRLLDDGVEDQRPFLVMERVFGGHFPGAAAPVPGLPRRWFWAAIAASTVALLEILGRVHASGVVHRDLKPENILVSDDGQPTVLDFGISLWNEPGSERLTSAGQILGTPAYLAPEQIISVPVDARADLYAVGAMLYQALTGRLPNEAMTVAEMLRARLMAAPTPVRAISPEVPAAVASVVDRLLVIRVEDRYRSALEVLAALRGEAHESWSSSALPRLGGQRAAEAVVAAAIAGRSVDVVGPSGSGRSRCLGEAAAALAAQSIHIARVEPARAPFASLAPLVFASGDHGALRLTEVTARVEAELRAALDEGMVLIVDDAERVDAWSRAVIDRCRAGAGVVVRALPAAEAGAPKDAGITLSPLKEAELRPLFAGPDRLFHLREDAARLLWERTEGLPARVAAEVALWVRLGLCRWDGPALVIDRTALSFLISGLPGAPPARAGEEAIKREPHLAELLGWLAIGGHHLELPQLAEVMGAPVWRLEAEVEALVEAGMARRVDTLRVAPRGQVDLRWSVTQRIEAHRAIADALRPGQPGRLFHLLKAEDMVEAAREAVRVARARVAGGDLGAATAALAEGLRAARHAGDVARAEEASLLAESVKMAFAERTPQAMDRVLYELARSRTHGILAEPLEALVRAAIAAPGAGGFWALETANEIPPFADVDLERRRHWVRARAMAVRSSLDLLEEVLEDIEAWASATEEPLARLCLAEARALLSYGQGRFDEAAALHAEAAEREPSLTGRITATLNASSALLEAFRHREAAERALAALELAARCRHAYSEGCAERLLRAARYRMGEAGAPDVELAAAVALLGVPSIEGLVCLVEAAQAFRVGEGELARELSRRAAGIGQELAQPPLALLSRCLELASGARAHPDEVARLADQAGGCRVTGIGIQALGLLGRAHPEARPLFRDAIPKLLEGIPREHWSLRMDVLSVDEALAAALGERESLPRLEGSLTTLPGGV